MSQANQREESPEPPPTETPRQEVRPESDISPTDIRLVPVIQPSTSARRGSALLVAGMPHKEKNTAIGSKKEEDELKSHDKGEICSETKAVFF